MATTRKTNANTTANKKAMPDTTHKIPRIKRGLNVPPEFAASITKPPAAVGGPDIFKPAAPPPGVVPIEMEHEVLASDDAGTMAMVNYAGRGYNGGGAMPMAFLGYPFLAELSQRPEYRHISETIAREMTRKWITLHAPGQGDVVKTAKILAINKEMDRLRVQDHFRRVVELDGFFGRGHLFLDFGDALDGSNELITMLQIDKSKINKRHPLRSIKVIEPTWTYPRAYNATNPLQDDYYKPQSWYVMGKEIHRSRLLTFVSREMPDLLKPAYSFGGLSLSQMAKPYVDHWLRTRNSVSDLIHSFSVMVLSTPMQALLQGTVGNPLINRVEAFNRFRDNRGTFVVDNDQEKLENVSAPLGTLDKLMAQSQEQMASVVQIPLVKFLGITPSGLNASSQDEIRVFYDNIAAMQQHLFAWAIRIILNVVQLSLFNEIDPDIDFAFESLWQMDEAQKATIRKTNADTAAVYMGQGVLAPDEQRKVIATEDGSPYAGIDLDREVEPPGEPGPGYNDDGGNDPAGGGGDDPEGGTGGTPTPPTKPAPTVAAKDTKFAEDAEDARTLVVMRPLLANPTLRAWAKDNGITLDDDLHTTIAYSKKPFVYDVMALKDKVTVTAGARRIMQLGNKLVLRFEDLQLSKRWKRICDLGATWDHPGYIFHVSLCDYTADMGTEIISPFGGQLVFGPEDWTEIPESKRFAEDAAPWYEGDHKRDKGGKFAKTASNGATIDDSKVEKLHESIKAGAAKSLGNKAKSALNAIGKVHSGKSSWNDVSPIDAPSTPLHHDINAYIKHHKEGSNVPGGTPGVAPATPSNKTPAASKTPDDKEVDKVISDIMDTVEGEKDAVVDQLQNAIDTGELDDDDVAVYKAAIKKLTATTPTPAPTPAPAMSSKTKELQKGIEDNMVNVTAQLKPTAEAKFKEITDALSSGDTTKIAALTPIADPYGMMQTKINEFMSSMKKDLGIKEPPKPTQGYQPTAAQNEQATKLNKAPAKRINAEHYFEDAGGAEVKSVLKANTKDIPEGFYGKVTAAYNGNHDHGPNGQLEHIDPVMEDYAGHLFGKLLTSFEISATASYQGSGSTEINHATAGLPPQPPSAHTQKLLDAMSSAIAKSPLPAETPVFRGICASLQDITGFDHDDLDSAVGRCFEHKAFASCSRSKQKSLTFAQGQTMMKFHIPAGTKALVMRKQSWEREVVLDKRCMFRIDKVEKGTNGVKHFIHATYLGQRSDDED